VLLVMWRRQFASDARAALMWEPPEEKAKDDSAGPA
jgi:uncharacterized membrane protein